ncbi:hypothetical protein [Gaoshiqia sediminis]|uniref:Phage protein n=1 Tax=Gaoshiqia sediminis TaxID=2986998 RepID=A0AA41YA25_9BACT|nr:hypothetical protein [Gaoshiqia sediminis]MCW0484072.1 hypothetical protein [Gaoshiqia sediminis]
MKKTEKKTKEVNFSNLIITDLDGKELKFDVSKTLGNHIYQTTGDLGMLEVAQTIYKKGEVELTEQVKTGLTEVVNNPQFPFLAVVKKKLLEELEG